MAKLQLVVSDPKNHTSRSVPLEGVKAQPLVGKSIGDKVDGKLLSIGNATLKITGGTDKDGIPMRADIQGTAKKRAILTSGAGFRSTQDGERRRKMVRGRVVGEETMQVNSVVIEGELSLPEPVKAEGEAAGEEKKEPGKVQKMKPRPSGGGGGKKK